MTWCGACPKRDLRRFQRVHLCGGCTHPRRDESRQFFDECRGERTSLFTSAEVLQELLHVYVRQGRFDVLEEAMGLVGSFGVEVWPLEEEDVREARRLADENPGLQARDLCHLASCIRRNITEIKTFDRALADAAVNLGNRI